MQPNQRDSLGDGGSMMHWGSVVRAWFFFSRRWRPDCGCKVASLRLPIYPPPPSVPSSSSVIFAPPTLYHPERFELRGGLFAHAIASPEAGSVDANLELVAP